MDSSVASSRSDIEIDKEQIQKNAIFFGKGDENDNITEYQKKVNLASIALCTKNPSLLFGRRGDLLCLAKSKVHEDGYNYKKGKSRSTKYGSVQPASEEYCTKRIKIDGIERKRRIDDIQDQIADLDKRIGFKNKRVEAAMAAKSFKACDEISEEISVLKSQRRELSCELAVLQKKQQKSITYGKKQKRIEESLNMDSSNPLSSSSSQQNTSIETVELQSDSSEHESQSSLQSNASKNTAALEESNSLL